jgi:hypothetical protein
MSAPPETIHRRDGPPGLLNNIVLVVNCLRKHEMQTAKSVYEGLLDLQYETPARQVWYVDQVMGREHLLLILRVFARDWPDFKPYPILHIEAHGDRDCGLEVAPGEFISWQDLFVESVAINATCDNNLGLVLSACHGYQLQELVKTLQPSPFNFMISAKGEVSANAAKTAMLGFYSALFKDLAVQRAFTSLPKGFDFFLSRNFFLLEMAHSYRKRRLGKARAEWIDDELSKHMARPLVAQGLGVNKTRQLLKGVITPNRKDFEEKSRIFFHGRTPMDFDEFMHFVRHERWPEGSIQNGNSS